MKTNHQRSFKDKKDGNAVFNSYIVFGKTVMPHLSDKSIGAGVTCGDHANGKRGIAKDRRGAKKFIRSRTRFNEKADLQKIVKNSDFE